MADISSANKRELVFPLVYAETDHAETPDETPINTQQITWQTEDSDEKVDISLRLSLNEFVALSSAIDVGMDIAFGEDALKIWWLWTTRLIEGGAMTCEDVADCIENDENVLNALLQQLAANGYTTNYGNTIPKVTLTPAQTAENLLPSDYSCTDAQMMATSREIVTEVNRAVVDLLESFELITDPSELLTEIADNFEGVSWLTTPLEVANWFQDELAAVYNAAYTLAVENALSCAIYCAMVTDCEITLDMLISIMESEMGSISPPPDPDDYEALFAWFIDIDTSVGTSVVAACYYMIFNLMRFAASITDIAVIADLKQIIAGSIGMSDTSYTECDDCPPTETPDTYWELKLQFAISQYGVRLVGSSAYLNGGIEGYKTGSVTIADFTIDDLGGGLAYRIAKVRMRSLRRGSVGNGVNDYKQLRTATGVGYTGTLATVWTVSNITCNTNDCSNSSGLLADGTPTTKAVRFLESVDGVTASDKVNVYEVTLYGYNHDDNKPTGAVWVSAIP